MSHQTTIVREENMTLRIDQVVVPSRISSKITLPVGGDPFTFCDENGGLLLTIDANGNIISEKGFFELSGQAAPAVSPAGKMRLYFDSASNKLLLSENGGAYADIMDGTGNVVGPGSSTDDALVRWDAATGKLIQDSNALLNDAGDLTLVGSQSLGKFLNVAGIAAPALSPAGEARLYFDSTSNKLRLSENGGAFDDIVGAGGDVVGPASATDDALVRWDTTTGKLVQDSLVTIDDDGIISTPDIIIGIASIARIETVGNQVLDLRSPTNKVRFFGIEMDFLTGGGASLGRIVPEQGPNALRLDALVSRLILENNEPDSASAVGFTHVASLLDKDTFTPGAIHTEWLDGGLDRIMSLTPDGELFLLGDLEIDGDLNHDGSNVGFYGTAPVAQSAAYTRNATIVEDRTLLASASATTINNNNVIAAMLADLQALGLLA